MSLKMSSILTDEHGKRYMVAGWNHNEGSITMRGVRHFELVPMPDDETPDGFGRTWTRDEPARVGKAH